MGLERCLLRQVVGPRTCLVSIFHNKCYLLSLGATVTTSLINLWVCLFILNTSLIICVSYRLSTLPWFELQAGGE